MPGGECTSPHRRANSAREDFPVHAPSLRRLVSIVFVTQVVDPDDPVLGFVVPQLGALAERCDLVVIANEVRSLPADVEFEVISLGKEVGRGTLARGVRYLAVLWRCFRRRRTDALVAHMCPIYLTIAAPLTRLFGITSLLWFLHPSDTPTLRIAEALADRVITAFPDSLPARRAKGAADRPRDRRRCPRRRTVAAAGGKSAAAPRGRVAHRRSSTTATSSTLSSPRPGAALTSMCSSWGRPRPRKSARTGKSWSSEYPADLANRIRIEPAVRAISDPVGHRARPRARERDRVGQRRQGRVRSDGRRPPGARHPAWLSQLSSSPIDTRLVFPAGDVETLSGRFVELAHSTEASLQELGARLRARVTAEHSLEHWAQEVTTLAGQGFRRGLPGIGRWIGSGSP